MSSNQNESPQSNTPTSLNQFIPSPRYIGSTEGMYFTNGEHGLGYYMLKSPYATSSQLTDVEVVKEASKLKIDNRKKKRSKQNVRNERNDKSDLLRLVASPASSESIEGMYFTNGEQRLRLRLRPPNAKYSQLNEDEDEDVDVEVEKGVSKSKIDKSRKRRSKQTKRNETNDKNDLLGVESTVFIPSPAYSGSIEGMYFTNGEQGLGYYMLKSPHETPSQLNEGGVSKLKSKDRKSKRNVKNEANSDLLRSVTASTVFVPSLAYSGSIEGMYFTNGEKGLGYYKLKPPGSIPSELSGIKSEGDNERECELFLPAICFKGSITGMIFKKGALGVGYYTDKYPSKQSNTLEFDSKQMEIDRNILQSASKQLNTPKNSISSSNQIETQSISKQLSTPKNSIASSNQIVTQSAPKQPHTPNPITSSNQTETQSTPKQPHTPKNSIESYPNNHLVNTKLRDYQKRICNEINNNALIVLPTGAGKTLIGIELCLKLNQKHTKPALFLVPTCLLVNQQAEAFRKETSGLIVEYMGNLKPPTSLQNIQVIVSTPVAYKQLSDTFPHKFGFNLLSCIVFDEVHHVVKKHPYRKISKLLSLISDPPQVIGLTASLTYSVTETSIENSIRDLCLELNIKQILTADEEELRKGGYNALSTNVKVSEESEHSINLYENIKIPFISDKPHSARKDFLNLIEQKSPLLHPITTMIIEQMKKLEILAKSIYPTFQSPFWKQHGKATFWGEYAHELAISTENTVFTRLEHYYEAIRLIFNSNQQSLEIAIYYLKMTQSITPEIQSLWEADKQTFTRLKHLKETILQEYKQFDKNIRCIIFVQQRLTTHILQHYIMNEKSLKTIIQCGAIYAVKASATASYSITKSQVTEILNKFAKGTYNFLISTAVAEEGMDVPKANCVIKFDPLQTAVSLVQSRGRARQEESSYVVMKENDAEHRKVSALLNAEKKQQQVILSNAGQVEISDDSKENKLKAQKDRIRNATSLFAKIDSENYPGPVWFIKCYAVKVAGEILESCKKVDGNFETKFTLVQFGYPPLISEGIHTQKKLSAKIAAIALIEQLKMIRI